MGWGYPHGHGERGGGIVCGSTIPPCWKVDNIWSEKKRKKNETEKKPLKCVHYKTLAKIFYV